MGIMIVISSEVRRLVGNRMGRILNAIFNVFESSFVDNRESPRTRKEGRDRIRLPLMRTVYCRWQTSR